MKLPKTFETLITSSQQLKLYNKLITQLNKDLKLANIDLTFDEHIFPATLMTLLQKVLNELIKNKHNDYLNFLYIVDVSEDQLNQLSTVEHLELVEAVTFLVLKREFQKVYFREKYSP